MEVGDKLKELNMTADEIDRFAQAFKDEKFRQMLRDYAEEISDPDNRKKYEEEIKILEQERGNSVEFIHPTPFRAVKTSVDGKQKCFINICASDKVGKPECKCVTEDGRRGQRWSLPHSLHPGRHETDPKGNKVIIYDVVFHPDTLHIASKNKRFLDMVEGTAVQGIQDAFKVTLDKNNMRQLRTKYKGTPQPCVIKKPIPGYTPKKPPEEPDLLAFPYPDEKTTTTVGQAKPTVSAPPKDSSVTEAKNIQIQPQKAKEPTKPKYTVKYRSIIDLQDFRCSRDSAQSPRPKEIVVTIDMPLLKSVSDTCLEVRERILLLESKKPAYKLELPLAYPVDEDKGEAKFNKQRGQLTVTLPVLPPNLPPDLFGMSINESDSVDDNDVESSVKEEDRREVTEKEEGQTDLEEEGRVETGEEEKEESEKSDEEVKIVEIEGSVEEEGGVQKNDKNPGSEAQEEKQEHEEVMVNQNDNKEISDNLKEDGNTEKRGNCAEEENSVSNGGVTSARINEKQENLISSLESTPKTSPTDFEEETRTNLQEHIQVKSDTTSNTGQVNVEESCVRSSKTPFATDDARTSSADKPLILTSEEAVVTSADPPTGQTCQTSECNNKPPPVLLREIDEDGNETVISDHSTSAGFTFQNTLMFELD